MPQFSIDEIFRGLNTKHRLTLFKPEDVQWIETQIFEKNGKLYLKCLASDKDRTAKPEEIVRQLWIKKLLEEYHYTKSRIRVEYAVWFGSGVSDKSADFAIMQNDGEHPYIIFEVKKLKRKDGLQQLKSYCNAEGSPIGVWSNGEELVVLHREEHNVFLKSHLFQLLTKAFKTLSPSNGQLTSSQKKTVWSKSVYRLRKSSLTLNTLF
ncbi:type I restriction enzyme HsdR N-terminal domain-containing protein [Caldichromatium japonicum]|uniref:Type I restriction enzyme HsdR N-terminal domain-containing protein n=1 Tax=Caldichromatium japonicum TaxID=2699430 RepID=A0A6G7V9J4_9GAMM|nr:type I restriction enzyme HsdR N-terminal domain-containing protein [Caldichromatium japonicum]QIK36729.1 type I restriction enzyme HsdR N-terminal domain-containing protein [Caldichromatium japonicum]